MLRLALSHAATSVPLRNSSSIRNSGSRASPSPLRGGLRHRRELVEGGAGLDGGFKSVHFEPPRPCMRPCRQVQQRPASNIFDRLDLQLRQQFGRTGEHHGLVCKEKMLGAWPLVSPEMDGGVQMLAAEIERPQLGRQVDGDAGVLPEELGQPWRQPSGAEGRHDAEIEHAAIRIDLQRRRRRPYDRKRAADVFQVGRTGW